MKRIQLFVILSIIASFLLSCDKEQKKDQAVNSTKLRVYCDEAIYNICQPPTAEFDSINYKLSIELVPTVAFDCMSKLLSGDAEAIIISRDYSSREDSLMKAYKVNHHLRFPLAYDALVFYTNTDNDIDSLTDVQIKDIFTNSKSSLIKYYPKSTITEFICNSHLSSEYSNFKKYILGNKLSSINIKQYSTSDSVLQYVSKHKNAIGIGYLSQLYKQPELRAIPISYVDSTGKYYMPHTVHQANIVRGFYPYKVTHYLYVFDAKADAPLAYSRYMSKSGNAQKFFNSIGIVPAFGDIRIKIEE